MTEQEALRAEVAATARQLARAGQLEAFGHVSARAGEVVAITTTRPLFACTPADVVLIAADGSPLDPAATDLPLERFLHLAIYQARPQVAAICRGHGRWYVAWGVNDDPVPVRHGLGLMAGERVGVHSEPLLISTPARAAAAASALGQDQCLILRGNGALATGTTLAEAAARLYALDERCRVALDAASRSEPPEEQDLWHRRAADTAVEMARHTTWFTARFAD
jgi:HCOMODA/2-hydroxy-3-carboxy-muconic semialdehyde decarboxylase